MVTQNKNSDIKPTKTLNKNEKIKKISKQPNSDKIEAAPNAQEIDLPVAHR